MKKAGGKWSLPKSPNTFPASPRVNERANERNRIGYRSKLLTCNRIFSRDIVNSKNTVDSLLLRICLTLSLSVLCAWFDINCPSLFVNAFIADRLLTDMQISILPSSLSSFPSDHRLPPLSIVQLFRSFEPRRGAVKAPWMRRRLRDSSSIISKVSPGSFPCFEWGSWSLAPSILSPLEPMQPKSENAFIINPIRKDHLPCTIGRSSGPSEFSSSVAAKLIITRELKFY